MEQKRKKTFAPIVIQLVIPPGVMINSECFQRNWQNSIIFKIYILQGNKINTSPNGITQEAISLKFGPKIKVKFCK